MNLLMVAPLFDSRGTLRYFIGAQVDVSGLLKDGTDTGLDAFANLIDKCENPNMADDDDNENQKDEFQSLSEMFNISELETVRTRGGSMHRDQVDDSDRESIASHRPRLLLKDPSSDILDQAARQSDIGNGETSARLNGRLEGVYQHVSSLIRSTGVLAVPDECIVPPSSPGAILEDPLHFPVASCARHSAVSFSAPHWRITAGTI